MNLLEHYIKEIKIIKPYKEEWTLKYEDKEFFEVVLVCVCHGDTKTMRRIWEKQEIIDNTEKGYFWT